MICSDLHCVQLLRDYIQTMLMWIGLVMRDMIKTIRRHILAQWAAAQLIHGILTDLVS